jgi:hypothetical protein
MSLAHLVPEGGQIGFGEFHIMPSQQLIANAGGDR